MGGSSAPPAPLAVIAPVHPHVSGAAQFNTAMVVALGELGPVRALSWRRLYPPLLHRRDTHDHVSRPARVPAAEPVLDWPNPRSWRAAIRRIRAEHCQTIVLPWIHPVMAPPYRYLLRHAPPGIRRVVICHNVEPHEPVPFGAALTRGVLRHADLLVTHASHQRAELAQLGLGATHVLEAFHPRFSAADLCRLPTPDEIAHERARQGHPEISLLAFGAIRPYKGIDLALEAVARTGPGVRLTVAGVFWDGGAALRQRVAELGIEDRVELRDGFVSNEDAARLFAAADASLLPYRSATQSGVVQLSFRLRRSRHRHARRRPRGGRSSDGVDGILCPPGDVGRAASAIARAGAERDRLADGVRRGGDSPSFRRYARSSTRRSNATGPRGCGTQIATCAGRVPLRTR